MEQTEDLYTMECKACKARFDGYKQFYNPIIHTCKAPIPYLRPKVTTIPSLSDMFENAPSGKTLKLSPKMGKSLCHLMVSAKGFLERQSTVTRIEFPMDGFYYVVAKLKERE